MNGFVGSATLQQNNGDNNAVNAGDWKEDLALNDESVRDNNQKGR